MTSPRGVLLLVRTMARTQRRKLVVWTIALVGSLAFTAVAVAGLYQTPEEIQSYGEAVVSNALVAINGRVEGIDSLGGIIQDEFGFLASFLMPLAGIALTASMTRAEEESGRLEALLSGRVDRRAPVLAAALLVLGAVTVMDLGFFGSLLVSGIDPSPAALYSLSLGLVILVFAALAAVLAQLVLHSRGVYAVGFVALALSYVLRGVGDVNNTFWVWLSPLGWLEKTAPFADGQRWWVLLIPLIVSVGLFAVATTLAGNRDLGAAPLRRRRPAAAQATGWLVGPIGLAWHRQLGSFLGWLVGSLALAAVMGTLADELVGAIAGNSSLSQATGITSADATDSFLAFTQVYLALIACGYAVQAIGALHREETAGRLEPMLAGTVGRPRWLGAQLLVVSACLAVMVTGSALALSVTTAASTGDSGYVGTVMKAGLAYLPAELVTAGLAVLLYGWAPRVFALAWGAFGLMAFVGLLGGGLQLPQWLLDLSPLTHVGNPPDGAVDPTALAWLLALALGLVVAAFATFRQRRVPQG